MRTKTIRLRSKKGMELVQVVTLTLIYMFIAYRYKFVLEYQKHTIKII